MNTIFSLPPLTPLKYTKKAGSTILPTLYYLARCLIQMGHTVVVVTHAYPVGLEHECGRCACRRGIRFLSNGLKVYYLPLLVFYNGVVLPTVFAPIPWFRKILIREKIQLVHGHSSFSTMAHECLFMAHFMDIATVFTDHSLFGFADARFVDATGCSIITNKLLQFTTSAVDHLICVSHTSKENTVLRAKLPPHRVSVIPNAVDVSGFLPSEKDFLLEPLTIVVVSRLVYRKGADLLAALVPMMCEKFPKLRWLVAGDGPKRVLLEQVREKHRLQERVHLLGMVPHTRVRDVLVRGQVFLNTSLTEAFCMTIVEAASCGLHVVATNVGGVPEVLPPDLRTLCPPEIDRLFESLCETCGKIEMDRQIWAESVRSRHDRVAQMYVWPNVAKRTEKVYRTALERDRLLLRERFASYFRCGLGFGLLFTFVASVVLCVLRVLQFLWPSEVYDLDVVEACISHHLHFYAPAHHCTKTHAIMCKVLFAYSITVFD